MRVYQKLAAIALGASLAMPLHAATSSDDGAASNTMRNVLQCVPYARKLTGISIFGDAYTWWQQAQGRYARGHEPREGAVLAIKPYRNSKLGHVAAVSRVVDSRTILISHANWSAPGKIENNVTALDVSQANDWSVVRVWYGQTQRLGTTHWPVAGFIYAAKPGETPKPGPRKRGRRHEDPIGEIIAGIY
ncbi:CHAP domain-containing protein [Novosphingobium sp. PC22D]|uniref:CHAP domain-containing protein n=1 Tax=Novosphingobium sp. PC22D TaxID=1962403 RepID=UPI000BF1116A|nr:CHAP domain-containing protein [Novosphingobium sp. PC22D]PEQ14614.1 CHAP domain-containing protein [Novosphingobium sp. PC22D]